MISAEGERTLRNFHLAARRPQGDPTYILLNDFERPRPGRMAGPESQEEK
jgi:hypothetical protein